jgi:hypothetical protein
MARWNGLTLGLEALEVQVFIYTWACKAAATAAATGSGSGTSSDSAQRQRQRQWQWQRERQRERQRQRQRQWQQQAALTPHNASIINKVHLTKPRNSYGSAALTPHNASILNKVHLTKPWEFTCFGCTHTTWGFNSKQGASHHTLGIQMVRLHSHHIRLQSKKMCISPKPWVYGLAAFTPYKASILNKVHLTKPKEFIWFRCTHTT